MQRAFVFYVSQRPGGGGIPLLVKKKTIFIRIVDSGQNDVNAAIEDAIDPRKGEALLGAFMVDIDNE